MDNLTSQILQQATQTENSYNYPKRTKAHLKHDHPNTTTILLINFILIIDTAPDKRRPPVEQVEMQGPITRTELLLFKEERIVQERKGVENMKVKLLSEDECVIDQSIQSDLQLLLHIRGFAEGGLGGIVE